MVGTVQVQDGPVCQWSMKAWNVRGSRTLHRTNPEDEKGAVTGDP